MPFAKSLKITSSVKLEGNESKGGGWGHAIWHSYPTAQGIATFTGREDESKLLELWHHVGADPKPPQGNEDFTFSATLPGQSAQTIFSREAEGSLSAIHLKIEPANAAALKCLWIRITWDGEKAPAVECPLGAFFGNELGYHPARTLMLGTSPDGTMYCYWPMPFWKSAKIELENRGAPTKFFQRLRHSHFQTLQRNRLSARAGRTFPHFGLPAPGPETPRTRFPDCHN